MTTLQARMSVKKPGLLISRRGHVWRLCAPPLCGRGLHIRCVVWSNRSNEKIDTTRVHIPQFTSALFFYDAMTVHLAAAASTIFVLYGFSALEGHHLGTPVLQSTVLQVSPLFLFACLTMSHTGISFSGFLSQKSRYRVIQNQITRHHSSYFLSPSLAPSTSSSLIM